MDCGMMNWKVSGTDGHNVEIVVYRSWIQVATNLFILHEDLDADSRTIANAHATLTTFNDPMWAGLTNRAFCRAPQGVVFFAASLATSVSSFSWIQGKCVILTLHRHTDDAREQDKAARIKTPTFPVWKN